jgi:hypothetical protein
MRAFSSSDQAGFVSFESTSLFDGQRFDFVMHTAMLLSLSEQTSFDQRLYCDNWLSILLV